MDRSMALAGPVLLGVVALAGCSSTASTDAASTASGSSACGAANDAVAPPINNAATGIAAKAELLDTQASSSAAVSIPNPTIPSIVQSCAPQSNGANPVVAINHTVQQRTFNYTDNPYLAPLVNFVNPSQLPAGFNCTINRETQATVAMSQPMTVPAGQSMVTTLITGTDGGQIGALGSSDHTLSIGGGASGNTQWYNLYLHYDSNQFPFQNWELAYENTGGLDPSQNTQPGLLNVVECSMSSDDTITTGAAVIKGTLTTLPQTTIATLTTLPQTTIATPYGSNTNRWQYNTSDPICLGFFDQNAAGVAFNPAS